MQAPPAIRLAIRHFGVWRALRAGLSASAAGAIALWWAAASAAGSALPAVGLIAAVACLLVSLPWRRAEPFWLRWDGQTWFVGAIDARPERAVAGMLTVAFDAGPWMLLRFVPADRARAGIAVRWLPVQQLGHERHWHLLRCAVFGARPAMSPPTGV